MWKGPRSLQGWGHTPRGQSHSVGPQEVASLSEEGEGDAPPSTAYSRACSPPARSAGSAAHACSWRRLLRGTLSLVFLGQTGNFLWPSCVALIPRGVTPGWGRMLCWTPFKAILNGPPERGGAPCHVLGRRYMPSPSPPTRPQQPTFGVPPPPPTPPHPPTYTPPHTTPPRIPAGPVPPPQHHFQPPPRPLRRVVRQASLLGSTRQVRAAA